MLPKYLKRGLVAGLIAGIVLAVFTLAVGTPFMGYAEEFEHAEESSAHAGDELSAATTGAIGTAASILWGLLLGVVAFGLGYYFLEPAIPGAVDTRSYLLAAVGFVTVSGAPWLVFPPQPPGVEQALSTDTRLVWYLIMMVAGALACGLAGYAYDRLSGRGVLSIAGALAPFALLAFPVVLAPPNPVESTVPDAVAASFRGLVVFGQLGLWFVLASIHAWLCRRGRAKDPGMTATDPGLTAD